MKLLVDCDVVFDRLTRAPFPGGEAEDAAVEAHLCVCHECRVLAEALRPAVDLLHESYPQAKTESLPEYRPARATPLQPQGVRGEWSMAWQLVAAALMGVMVSALAIGGWSRGENTAAHPTSREAGSVSGFAQLASLNLRESCLPTSNALAAGTERLRCCTDCHSASVQKGIEVARMQLACIACHEPQVARHD